MSVRLRLGARLSAVVVVTAIPVVMSGVSPAIVTTAQTTTHTTRPAVPSSQPSPEVSTAPITPAITTTQQRYLGRVSDAAKPQAVAQAVTIQGGLSLATKADRNRKIAVASSKGTLVVTASSLAEHDLPSAALRAYKNAARSIDTTDPGCHLSWTLLAGIGRVESDHGRYGGSVLGVDGVPRPAIVGIALNGKGPVAAIHDTDHGKFDGDTVWDRAVGPMQFIPSTWRYAGRDGDGDGVKSPNDIDDAALAAAAYLCNGGGNLGDEDAQHAAIMRYNASDYYVALVSAFAKGYRTGVFVIPSPPVAAGAGDGVVHLKAHHAKKKAKKAKKKAKVAPVVHHSSPKVTKPVVRHPVSTPKPPTKKPTVSAPKPVTVTGKITANPSGSFTVGSKTFAASDATWDLGSVDGVDNGASMADRLQSLVAMTGTVTLTYLPGSGKVDLVEVKDLTPVPPAPTASPSAAPAPAE